MTCPNCHACDCSLAPYKYRRCDVCGVYFLPDVTKAEIEAYYASGAYRQKHQQRDETAHQTRRAENIVKYLDNPHIFLDIGCSKGILMDVVHKRFGAVVYGVDPDPLLALGVYRRLADVPAAPDCVTLIHSLEHMLRPLDTLREIRARMAPGGQIVVEVPNGSLPGPCYFSAFKFPHVVMFSEAALRWTLVQAGFTVERTVIHGDGGVIGALESYYLLMIGRKD